LVFYAKKKVYDQSYSSGPVNVKERSNRIKIKDLGMIGRYLIAKVEKER
jgi:hypothetical protein